MNKEDKRTSGGLFYRNVNFIPGCVLEMLRNLIPVGAHEGYVPRSPSDYLLAALLAKSFNFDDCNILISSFVSFYSRNKLLTRRKWRE